MRDNVIESSLPCQRLKQPPRKDALPCPRHPGARLSDNVFSVTPASPRMFRVKDEYFKKDDSIFGKWEISASSTR